MHMYIAHYKSVLTADEFYSKKRESLDFPTQVELSGQRYLLKNTYLISSPSAEKSLINSAEKYGIKVNVEIA